MPDRTAEYTGRMIERSTETEVDWSRIKLDVTREEEKSEKRMAVTV